MEINLLNLRNSINKAFLKVKPNRTQIEAFKKNITNLFDQIKESESEEFHKNIISEFLKNTYYSPINYINTKSRYDLVIHNGKGSNSTVGVLFEVKKPSNKSEMPTCENINTKAFHELILYYLRERISNKNIEVKHLVITNIFEWFIFNSNDFEKLFAEDKSIVKQFTDFEEGRLSGTNTDFFYKNIAEPFCKKLESSISVTHFDIRDFETTIKNTNRKDDNKLITLYKILSPEHLLKLPFANDSNNLDKTFYNELLHIIGLEETKEGSKKLIGRKIEKKRNPGSFIENSITILKYEDCLNQLPKLSDYGRNKEEQLFNIALELVITWINRILFLKLLEGQLIKYNNGDKAFRFLNIERIHDYDELNKLFFQVLAVKESDRSELIKQKFRNIPYLNSSLFEPSDLEHKTIRINSLDDHSKHPVLTGTVLKDNTGRKLTGEIDPLQYLFEFLDSYDFSSEGSEDIQEENKTLINASVLGLIFEKINGYKDGSFFTPGFITMYMCHETIRRAVVQKFNEVKGWQCETISDVYNKIENIKEADKIINSLKICDPAVGSGHFLVSALNEIIAIKSELKILTDREGKKLKEYTIEVINDELIITDEQSKLFEYNPKSKESQRVQEALFQEKQKIIESCLFGVDINSNSVKICRLRLWIELLKNAYFKSDTNFRELETLPNIDINIKCGNSLISRYPLDADIKTALKSSKWNVDNYREAVMSYRNAQSKDEKRSMEQLISKIKNDFETEVSKSDKRFLKLNKLNGELLSLTGQSSLFELTKTQKEGWKKKVKKLTEDIKKYETEIEQIKSNKIYENAFEWRFEFPEVLNNDGDFVGFDVVIGNPPYISAWEMFGNDETQRIFIKQNYDPKSLLLKGHWDLYIGFILHALKIGKEGSSLTYIIPNPFLREKYASPIRDHLLKTVNIKSLTLFEDSNVFDEVARRTIIIDMDKKDFSNNEVIINETDSIHQRVTFKHHISKVEWLKSSDRRFNVNANDNIYKLLDKIDSLSLKVGNLCYVNYGAQVSSKQKDYFSKEDVVSKSQIGNAKQFIEGKDIHRWHVGYRGLWLDYRETDMYGARFSELFENEKIIIRKISDRKHRVAASIDDSYKYTDDGCVIALPYPKLKEKFNVNEMFGYKIHIKNYSLEFLLSQLLNNVSTFYFKNKFSTESLQGETSHTYPKSVRELPIYNATEQESLVFSKLVTLIINTKKIEPAADTSALESEIDRLVYELYGLTEEEIRIVEN